MWLVWETQPLATTVLADADVDFLCSEEGLKSAMAVLEYHVLPFPLPSVLIEEGHTTYETVQGSYLTVTYLPDEKAPENTVAMVNDANILDVDYGALNGKYTDGQCGDTFWWQAH